MTVLLMDVPLLGSGGVLFRYNHALKENQKKSDNNNQELLKFMDNSLKSGHTFLRKKSALH